MNANNGIVISSNKLTKEEETAILEAGMGSLEDFFDSYQYVCFVLDASGSIQGPRCLRN
jgi:hypothetical protein